MDIDCCKVYHWIRMLADSCSIRAISIFDFWLVMQSTCQLCTVPPVLYLYSTVVRTYALCYFFGQPFFFHEVFSFSKNKFLTHTEIELQQDAPCFLLSSSLSFLLILWMLWKLWRLLAAILNVTQNPVVCYPVSSATIFQDICNPHLTLYSLDLSKCCSEI